MGEADRHRASSWDDFGDDPESRVELYERAAAMADAGTLSEADAQWLVQEYRNRVIKATFAAGVPAKPGERPATSAWSPEGVGTLIAFAVLSGAAIWWPASAPSGVWTVVLPGVAVAVGLVVWIVILRGRYRFRRRGGQLEFASAAAHVEESLTRRMCPDCGYALEGLHPSIGLIEGNGVAFGPRACPECGTRWPLVPGRVG
jgi:ribosomal protein S27AE